MKINIIAACDNNGLIGLDNKLPWYLPEDMRRFRELTEGHAVIMGRNTWESLPVKPLPNRTNVVVSGNYEWSAENVINCVNLKSALGIKFDQVFLIGGQKIFEDGIKQADTVYLTIVKTSIPPNITARYFPVEYLEKHFKQVEVDWTRQCIFQRWERVNVAG